jgi:hypothetical protein
MKEKYEVETYWSMSTPLAVKLPNWKHYPLDLYLAEYIVTLRMRGYMIKDDYTIHSVMADNEEVVMYA